ncbi:hypothetical protein [Abyssisolibacter fermentans]|uniref:hypothetical protein n=1 Tax=Abyssisolibacter fermentans TaxID=1766203 RepID=UPI00083047CC|nr:hypothetical protein [Abyssisolibacter fermentans]
MNNAISSMNLNLSNQANTIKSEQVNLSQFNFFVILGLEYLYEQIENNREIKGIPIDISIKKSGEMTINGLDQDLIDDNNIRIYSDKKVTNSNK